MRFLRFSEANVQQMVHHLEEGGWVRVVKTVLLLLAAIAFVCYLWFFKEGNGFKGLTHEKGIEQAQIAREISRGHGFTTKVIRPAALWQFERELGAFPLDRTPDTYHAPLNPYVNALVFKMMDGVNVGFKWVGKEADYFHHFPVLGMLLGPIADYIGGWAFENVMTTKLLVFAYDRMIAATQVLFFLLSVLVNYYTARRLFDDRLAVFGVGMILLCEKFWDYAMTGLPQMLMLLLFSGAAHTMVRAIEARVAGRKPLRWLVATASLFGLLALAHGLTIWLLWER